MTSLVGQIEDQQNNPGVLSLLHDRAEKFGDRPAFCIKEGDGWRTVTYKELSERVVVLSTFLMDSGLKSGERVAILSDARPEWGIAFFASVRAGATTVPLDVKLTETELVSILSDCCPSYIFVDGKHADMAMALKEKISSIREVLLLEDGQGRPGAKSISELVVKEKRQGCARKLDEAAVFVYTSGTTGSPKGVMTSFANLVFQTSSFESIIDLNANDRFLSLLPLNHLLELTGGFLGVLNLGGMVCFCQSIFPQEIIRVMRERKITGMIGVPLLFKSLKGGIEREIKRKGEGALEKFHGALDKAKALSHEQRRQLFAPVLDELGGELRVLIAGGAPLEVEVAEFFDLLGIPLLQGYGLTETSPVISGNALRANKLGSVGKPLPEVEVRIDKKSSADTEGEILTRGPHVMLGYHNQPELTHETIDEDGWLHTGDIGKLDEDGFLFITGRLKNMIVLGGGKKIFPEEVEAAFGTAHSIKELCVLGRKSKDGFKEGTEEVCVVVVPADSLASECKGDQAKIYQTVKKELDELGQHLAPYKRPTKIVIREDELPKTATRKVKRPLVQEWLKTLGD